MQHTHGNRAVQRALSASGGAGIIAVQRDPWEEFDPDEALRNVEAYTSYGPSTSNADTVQGGQPFGPAPLPKNPFESLYQAGGNAASASQNNDHYLPPAPPLQDAYSFSPSMEDFWKRFGSMGDVNNMLDVSTTAVEAMTTTSAAKKMADASELAQIGKGAGKIGTGGNVLGVGMGIYNFANAKDNYERVQAGADTVASGVGFLGPVGGAFSAGYSGGQLLNKGADWIGDWITGNEEGDHSLSGLLSDGMVAAFGGESLPEQYMRVQEEKATEKRIWQRAEKAGRTKRARAENARIESEHEAGFQDLMAQTSGMIENPYAATAHIGMINPVARPGQAQGIEEDPLPMVPMALPSARR